MHTPWNLLVSINPLGNSCLLLACIAIIAVLNLWVASSLGQIDRPFHRGGMSDIPHNPAYQTFTL